MMSFTMAGLAHKAVYASIGALAIGAGSLVLHLDHNDTKQDIRIDTLETAVTKLADVPVTLATIEGQVRGIDIKVTDIKEAQKDKRK